MTPHRHLQSALLLALTAPLLSAQAIWQPLTTTPDPTDTAHTIAVGWDESNSTLVWVGNLFVGGNLEFQRYDGTGWTIEPTTGTPPSGVLGACWDSVRSTMVFAASNGTFEWHSGLWVQISPTAGPQGGQVACCFDAARNESLFFGGSIGGGYTNDLWAWDGVNWTLRASNGPSERSWSAMAYDPQREVVLMHGGWYTFLDPYACLSCDPTIVVMQNDTWEWDGSSWTSAGAGPAIKAHAMTWDPARERMMFFGGSTSSQFLGTTYERVNGAWQLRSGGPAPGPRNNPRMTFDPVRQRVHMMGGYHSRDQWTFATPQPATQSAFGTGCGGASGAPELAGLALPYTDDDWSLEMRNLPGSATTATLILGFGAPPAPVDLTPIGMPACFLYGNATVALNASVSAGVASFDLAIDDDPVLGGLMLTTQGFVPDPTANALGLGATQGLESVIGIR